MESSSSSSSSGSKKYCSYAQVKVICCNDLKAFNFFQKLSVYAVVSIASDDPSKKVQEWQVQSQRTGADPEGDGNPEWNHQLRFDLGGCHGADHLFLHFDLRHQGIPVFGFGDKTIGEVRIPLKDVMEDACNGVVRFVSYQVRNTDGKPNGVLNLSYTYYSNNHHYGTHTTTTSEPQSQTVSGGGDQPVSATNTSTTIFSSSSSGFQNQSQSHHLLPSNSMIQYPTVQVEPVALPIPTPLVNQSPYNYWPNPKPLPLPLPLPLELDCWSSQHPPPPPPPPPPPHPTMMFAPSSYYHTPADAPLDHLPPWRPPHHHPYLMAVETHGYDQDANVSLLPRPASIPIQVPMPLPMDGELGHASLWK